MEALDRKSLIRLSANFLLFILYAFLLFPGPAKSEQTVTAWCYYHAPPFVVSPNKGLSHDFIKLMNKKAKGRYVFKLDLVPKRRLDLFLQNMEQGIVLFVSPMWMPEPIQHEQAWTSAIFRDWNEILSNVTAPVEYKGPESVYGLTMGGVLGHYYKGLDEIVTQGKLTRIDAQENEQNVLKICKNRGINFTTAPRSTLKYLIKKHQCESLVYVCTQSLFQYDRSILMNNIDSDLQQFITMFVQDLTKSGEWQEIKRRYHLD